MNGNVGMRWLMNVFANLYLLELLGHTGRIELIYKNLVVYKVINIPKLTNY